MVLYIYVGRSHGCSGSCQVALIRICLGGRIAAIFRSIDVVPHGLAGIYLHIWDNIIGLNTFVSSAKRYNELWMVIYEQDK